MKQTIIRNGKEITRNMKPINYDSNINIRISKESINDLKEIAEKYGMKYNTFVRTVLEECIKICKNM